MTKYRIKIVETVGGRTKYYIQQYNWLSHLFYWQYLDSCGETIFGKSSREEYNTLEDAQKSLDCIKQNVERNKEWYRKNKTKRIKYIND